MIHETKTILCTLITIFVAASAPLSAAANVRFTKIEPSNNRLMMKNFGTTSVDMSNWYFSSHGSNLGMKSSLVTVEAGSTTLAPGAEVTLVFTVVDYLSEVDPEN